MVDEMNSESINGDSISGGPFSAGPIATPSIRPAGGDLHDGRLPSRSGAGLSARVVVAGTLAALMLAAGGCTTQTREMVDAGGREWTCAQTGWGGIGMRQARSGVAICRDAMVALGYLDRERAGGIGVLELAEGPSNPIISRISPGSPAARLGIADGAMLISVDGRRVWDAVTARDLLFGPVGTTTRVVVLQGEDTLTYSVLREQEVVEESGHRYWPGMVAALPAGVAGAAPETPAAAATQ